MPVGPRPDSGCDGLGYRILTELGITLDRVRSETAKLIVCRPASDKVC
jgi:hypothetical protein